MITIKHKNGQVLTKSNVKANAILNNKIFGSDWSVVHTAKDAPAPPEAIKERVSIAEPDKKTTKGKKINAD